MSLGRDGLRAADRECNESVMVRYWVEGFWPSDCHCCGGAGVLCDFGL